MGEEFDHLWEETGVGRRFGIGLFDYGPDLGHELVSSEVFAEVGGEDEDASLRPSGTEDDCCELDAVGKKSVRE